MTTEELKKLIPKARYAKLEKEITEFVDKTGPLLMAIIPFAEEDMKLKERYARLKVQPEWITDLTDNIMQEKFPAVFEAMNK